MPTKNTQCFHSYVFSNHNSAYLEKQTWMNATKNTKYFESYVFFNHNSAYLEMRERMQTRNNLVCLHESYTPRLMPLGGQLIHLTLELWCSLLSCSLPPTPLLPLLYFSFVFLYLSIFDFFKLRLYPHMFTFNTTLHLPWPSFAYALIAFFL